MGGQSQPETPRGREGARAKEGGHSRTPGARGGEGKGAGAKEGGYQTEEDSPSCAGTTAPKSRRSLSIFSSESARAGPATAGSATTAAGGAAAAATVGGAAAAVGAGFGAAFACRCRCRCGRHAGEGAAKRRPRSSSVPRSRSVAAPTKSSDLFGKSTSIQMPKFMADHIHRNGPHRSGPHRKGRATVALGAPEVAPVGAPSAGTRERWGEETVPLASEVSTLGVPAAIPRARVARSQSGRKGRGGAPETRQRRARGGGVGVRRVGRAAAREGTRSGRSQ